MPTHKQNFNDPPAPDGQLFAPLEYLSGSTMNVDPVVMPYQLPPSSYQFKSAQYNKMLNFPGVVEIYTGKGLIGKTGIW